MHVRAWACERARGRDERKETTKGRAREKKRERGYRQGRAATGGSGGNAGRYGARTGTRMNHLKGDSVDHK